MKNDKIQEKILDRINSYGLGSVFLINDFIDIAEEKTVQKVLSRLQEKDIIKWVMRGVYFKPLYIKNSKKYASISMNKVAEALARKFNWTICLSGKAALNALNLSVDQSDLFEYVSSGPNRQYEINDTKIIFRHCKEKEISNFSYITALVIQALRAIGKNNITDKHIDILKYELTEDDKITIYNEAKFSTSWIYKIIKKICEI